MNSWREKILNELIPGVTRLTLVVDPDGLIFEEEIMEEIRARGFELIEYSENITYRYEFESKYRTLWDQNEPVDLVVVVKTDENSLLTLPYDILEASRKLFFRLGDVFPDLSYSVMSALDRSDFNSLFDAHKRYVLGPLGENATKDFVLRHVFEFAAEMINDSSDLLRFLLRKHYKGQHLPALLNIRCIELLRNNSVFDEWPLEAILADRDAFFTFLQERWPLFIDRKLSSTYITSHEAQAEYNMTIEGIVDLPFDHQDIRVYLDNMFTEGLLNAIYHEEADNAADGSWYKVGLITDRMADKAKRLTKLIDRLNTLFPSKDAKHNEWLNYARIWAELTVLRYEQHAVSDQDLADAIFKLQHTIDCHFSNWLARRYASLINLPPVPPVALHQIPRFLSRKIETNGTVKVAMIVIDGLSLDQWLILEDELQLQKQNLVIRDSVIFAWIPTVTSVSRQAAFSGKAPSLFPDSIYTTDKDGAQWTRFWADQGLNEYEVVYKRGLGEGSLDNLNEALSHPQVKIVGLVIDKVDKIMHGMELGMAGMHNQVRQWAQQSYLSDLIDLLLDKQYLLLLTSDHGNIEAKGFGVPKEGVLAEKRGERVRVYSDHLLRSMNKTGYEETIEWPCIGLPSTYLPLIAGNRYAFVSEGKTIVGHGGLSIEEIIVPLIEIERKH